MCLKHFFTRINAFALAILLLGACSDDTSTVSGDFDRQVMLTNIADNIIIPNFANLQNQVNTLNQAVTAFTSDANQANLVALQTVWLDAHNSWQHCSTFNFGDPGNRNLGTLDQALGTFPVSTTKIENAISAQDFSLNTFDRDVRGFLAVEYLIFGSSGDEAVLAAYQSTDPNSENRKQYLQAVVTEIKDEIDDVNLEWQSYRDTFIASDGTSAGSSVSLLFNSFSQSYEAVKNFKVGLPAGKRPGQNAPEPDKVEAFFSGKSRDFILQHLDAVEDIWLGSNRSGSDGIGFEEYLLSVEGGAQLVEDTRNQLEVVKNSLNAIPQTPLSETIVNNIDVVDQAHTELQKHTRFFKSEMASLLGISITFNSGDGD